MNSTTNAMYRKEERNSMPNMLTPPVAISAERPFRHTVAFIPECRPDILSPAWFDWLKEIGYTGV